MVTSNDFMERGEEIYARRKRAEDTFHFELAHWIVEEFGPPPMQGKNDGSYEALASFSARIQKKYPDYECDLAYLSRMRTFGANFSKKDIVPGLSFSAHREARTPAMLAKVLERIGHEKPTARLIDSTRKKIEEEEAPVMCSKLYGLMIDHQRALEEWDTAAQDKRKAFEAAMADNHKRFEAAMAEDLKKQADEKERWKKEITKEILGHEIHYDMGGAAQKAATKEEVLSLANKCPEIREELGKLAQEMDPLPSHIHLAKG